MAYERRIGEQMKTWLLSILVAMSGLHGYAQGITNETSGKSVV